MSERPPRVLVTDAEQRAALAACRGLARANYVVAAAAASPIAVSHWSRSCATRVRLPEPREDPVAYVDALAFELESGDYDVLLPGSEASLLPISERRERLEPLAAIGLPRHEIVLRALDKHILLDEAQQVGLDPPPSIVCASAIEARAAALELGLPVLVKPSRSFLDAEGSMRQETARVVHDLAAVDDGLRAIGAPCTLQVYARNARVVSCGGVRAGERLLASGFCRYTRTWPALAGNASMAITITPPPGLAERVEHLLQRIGWEGIFEVEMLEQGNGHFSAIDLNPRVFGQMSLLIGAGANLPALWCDHLLGRPTRGHAHVRPGTGYRWEDAELRHFAWQARHGHLRAAAAVLRPHRGVVHAHFRATDPGPLIARVLHMASQIPRRARTHLAATRASVFSGKESSA